MGDIGGLFESLLLLAGVFMKIFGTNFLDLYIIDRVFKTTSHYDTSTRHHSAKQPKHPLN